MTEHDDRQLTEDDAHPEDLLAGHVEGALSGPEASLVQRHLVACPTCREEVRLAKLARSATSKLPALDVPEGLTRSVLDRARLRRQRSPALWGTGAAAAVAAAAVILFAVLHGGGSGGNPVAANSALSRSGAGGAGGEAAGRQAPISVSKTDFDPAKIQTLVGRLAAGFGHRALSRSSAGPPRAAPQAGAAGDTSSAAVACIDNLASPTRNDTVIEIIVARFRGTPAFIAAFDHRPSPGEPPNLITVWVGSRQGCRLLHYASQPLGG